MSDDNAKSPLSDAPPPYSELLKSQKLTFENDLAEALPCKDRAQYPPWMVKKSEQLTLKFGEAQIASSKMKQRIILQKKLESESTSREVMRNYGTEVYRLSDKWEHSVDLILKQIEEFNSSMQEEEQQSYNSHELENPGISFKKDAFVENTESMKDSTDQVLLNNEIGINTTIQTEIVGVWNLVCSNNMDAYMKEMGVGLMARTLAGKQKPTLDFTVNGEDWSMTTTTHFNTSTIKWVLGQDFDECTTDDEEMSTKIFVENNHLYQLSKGKDGFKYSLTDRYIENGMLIIDCKCNDVKCQSVYEKAD